MYAARLWSVRHARALEILYHAFERVLRLLHPAFRLVGYDRLDKPVAKVEKVLKGFFFDCRMCGQCVLSSTGMSCPMNCPKQLRNGPCGGVREDGCCEVHPQMRCAWVEAFDGARSMHGGLAAMRLVQLPVDRRLEGSSSWLKVAREQARQ